MLAQLRKSATVPETLGPGVQNHIVALAERHPLTLTLSRQGRETGLHRSQAEYFVGVRNEVSQVESIKKLTIETNGKKRRLGDFTPVWKDRLSSWFSCSSSCFFLRHLQPAWGFYRAIK